MPFTLFFESCLKCLIPRIEAAFPEKGNSAILHGYEANFKKAVRDTERRKILKALIDYFNIALWMKDINNIFFYLNEGCCSLILFHATDEALFKRDTDFDKDQLAHLCILGDKKVIKRNESIRFIEHARYDNGKNVWVDVCKCPTHAPGGRITGTLGCAVDLSLIVAEETKNRFVEAQSIEIPMDEILTISGITKILEEYNKKS